jgi:hypothetical protein
MSVPTITKSPNYNYSPQPRKSRTLLWIVLGSTIGVLLFTALVGASAFFALHSFFQQTDQSVPVVASYGLAFMRQDYANAYSHLDSQATINGEQVDQQSFTALATSADSHYGKVSGYSIDSLSQGNDSSNITITVHRGDQNYQIHLQLKLEGNDWKIISADGV